MITAHTNIQHADSLAKYMPNGILFEAKNIDDSNFRQLLLGLAGELFTAEGYLITLQEEYLPDQTVLFLDEWEQALGIPDSCFSGTGTLNERRRDIVVKLSSLGVQTILDFEALAALFSVSVTILAGNDPAVSPAITPIRDARNTIVVEFIPPFVFPYTFPINFGSQEISILECLFEKLKPSTSQVLFQSV